MIKDQELLERMIAEGYISVQLHPECKYRIFNYTPKTQFENMWNEGTVHCRGLILNEKGDVVARPFKKFLNLEQIEDLPNEPFRVFDKMDGSLGILYWRENAPYIATRGSFNSDQAKHANRTLHNKYAHVFPLLRRDKTYLFEIIYPENRIVVDYNGMDDLVLLAVIDNSTGLDEELPNIGFPVVKEYDGINDISRIKELGKDNMEGFVVRFKSGLRTKIKLDEYVRLHKIVTGVSNLTIWEYLSKDKDFNELVDRVPDEFHKWVKETRDQLQETFNSLKKDTEERFWKLIDKKEFAEKAKKEPHPSLLFTRLNSYSGLDEQIWRMIKPEFSKPFNKKSEDDKQLLQYYKRGQDPVQVEAWRI